MSSSKISVLGQRINTLASTRIFSVTLISKERRVVDLQGHSDAQSDLSEQLGLNVVRRLSDRIPNSSGFEDLAEVIGPGFEPVEVDQLHKRSVYWAHNKSSSDELFWAELLTGRITAPKLDLIGIDRLSF
ncbi:hypothetical protein PIB30_026274 [Stylosanthes scabra]|uniref:Uncharacterized protein n=1 Tax=Stylosanthes scabra TaxID=79078 RepID=A0ABU6TA46_9FABA|nr:hypothetical protein [Stylosanthes scabra]